MDPTELTVDELIAASAALDDRTGGLCDRLARITAQAADTGTGVEVEVTLDGMLVGLRFAPAALRLGPQRLATEIHRLTQRASEIALAEGIAAVEPVAGDLLLALGVGTEVARPAAGADDFPDTATWAVP